MNENKTKKNVTSVHPTAFIYAALILALSSLLFQALQYGFSFFFPELSKSPDALAGIVVSGAFFALLSKVSTWGVSSAKLKCVLPVLFVTAWILGVVAESVYLFAPNDPNDFTVTDNYLASHQELISQMRLFSVVVGVLTVVMATLVAVFTRTGSKHTVALLCVCLMWLACTASIWAEFLGLTTDMVLSSTLFALGMGVIIWTVYRKKGATWLTLLFACLLVVGSFVAEYVENDKPTADVVETPAKEGEMEPEEMELELETEEEGFSDEYVEEEGFVDEASASDEEYSEEEGFVDE